MDFVGGSEKIEVDLCRDDDGIGLFLNPFGCKKNAEVDEIMQMKRRRSHTADFVNIGVFWLCVGVCIEMYKNVYGDY